MKLYQRLEKWSYMLRYRAIYEEMKYHIKLAKKDKIDHYLKKIYRDDRGIGKTYSLVQLAVKYNIPIIVPTYQWKNTIEKHTGMFLPPHLRKNSKPIVLHAGTNFRGHRFDIVLVEEGLSDEQMALLHNVAKHIIGYRNIY